MKIVYTSQFKRDYKKAISRGKDLSLFYEVVDFLLKGLKLPPKYKVHNLSGKFRRHRDCHIESDWILIYRIDRNTLFLERMGTHTDLFK